MNHFTVYCAATELVDLSELELVDAASNPLSAICKDHNNVSCAGLDSDQKKVHTSSNTRKDILFQHL